MGSSLRYLQFQAPQLTPPRRSYKGPVVAVAGLVVVLGLSAVVVAPDDGPEHEGPPSTSITSTQWSDVAEQVEQSVPARELLGGTVTHPELVNALAERSIDPAAFRYRARSLRDAVAFAQSRQDPMEEVRALWDEVPLPEGVSLGQSPSPFGEESPLSREAELASELVRRLPAKISELQDVPQE